MFALDAQLLAEVTCRFGTLRGLLDTADALIGKIH
jgi:hypothetical protein